MTHLYAKGHEQPEAQKASDRRTRFNFINKQQRGMLTVPIRLVCLIESIHGKVFMNRMPRRM